MIKVILGRLPLFKVEFYQLCQGPEIAKAYIRELPTALQRKRRQGGEFRKVHKTLCCGGGAIENKGLQICKSRHVSDICVLNDTVP